MKTEPEIDHEALLQFLYLAPIGLAQICINGEVSLINPVCAKLLLPLAPHGNLSNLFMALQSVAPDLQHRAREFAPRHGMVCDSLQIPLNAGVPGRTEPQILSLSLLKLDHERLMVVLNDVSLAVKRERQLRQTEAWFNAIFTGVTDYALMAIDAAGRIDGWNPSIERLTGFTAAGLEGATCACFYAAGAISDECLLDRLHEADLHGWSLDEGWRLRADGSRFWGSCLIAPLQAVGEAKPDEARSYSLIIRDVSERRESNEALRRAVSCDHLTGLANRRAFFDAAALQMRRWQRAPRALSVAVVDADHFKAINDRHGHAGGDAVLRALAAAMSASFREVDTVARVGGEEFAVLLPGVDLQRAGAVATRLCEHVAALAVEVDDAVIRFTVSIGVAAMELGLAGFDDLIKRADKAMYEAKANGRNRVALWPPAPLAPLARPVDVAPA